MLLVSGAYLLGERWADTWLDAQLEPTVGANVSDLVQTLGITAACWVIGLSCLAALYGDNQIGLGQRYVRVWTAGGIVTAATLITTSRAGDARTVPVRHEFELVDPLTIAYNVVAAGAVGITCAILTAASLTALRDHRAPLHTPLLALLTTGLLGVLSAIATVTLLMVNAELVRDRVETFTVGTSAPILACLAAAGLYGLAR
ncbi:hypothetical protein DFR74_111248 [Nocardia puris]|uniref:Uncharacterized protein n=2 Tax=Nocardia puris TaxID=208602 RepID=A0A366DBW1_9NOCA|nr:hypothetical protein DFR74_111248 [Nocardia puris]